MKRLKIFGGMAVLTCLFLVLNSCYNNKADQLVPATSVTTCDTASVSYATDILPILQANCNISGGCHDAAGAATSGYDFENYKPFAGVAASGQLYADITHQPGSDPMPKNGAPIAACDVNKIVKWVHEGAPNN